MEIAGREERREGRKEIRHTSRQKGNKLGKLKEEPKRRNTKNDQNSGREVKQCLGFVFDTPLWRRFEYGI